MLLSRVGKHHLAIRRVPQPLKRFRDGTGSCGMDVAAVQPCTEVLQNILEQDRERRRNGEQMLIMTLCFDGTEQQAHSRLRRSVKLASCITSSGGAAV